MPKLETLVDPFTATVDKTTKWPNSAAQVVWDASGRAKIPCTTSYYALATAMAGGYDLAGSYVLAQYVCPPVGNGSRETYLEVLRAGGGTDKLSMFVAGTSLYGRVTVGGANMGQLATTYNATSHAWWRIRESGGTVYFDHSPDGTTWTNLYSAAPGFNVTSVWVNISTGYWGTETAADAYVDNVNNPPPSVGWPKVWTGSAWVKKPAKVWTGSAWVQKPVKVWTGSAWKTVA